MQQHSNAGEQRGEYGKDPDEGEHPDGLLEEVRRGAAALPENVLGHKEPDERRRQRDHHREPDPQRAERPGIDDFHSLLAASRRGRQGATQRPIATRNP